MELHAVYKKPYFFYKKSRENLYQVLQVTWEFISGTTSHVHCVWLCNKIKGLYDKIMITIVPSYTGFDAIGIVTRTTHSNKLVMFSGIALY